MAACHVLPLSMIEMICLRILPLLVAVPVIGEIVKTASLLSAIAELNVSVMGSVLEEMEARKSVLTELKINIEKSLSAENGFSPKVFK